MKWYIFECKNGDGRIFVVTVNESSPLKAWESMLAETATPLKAWESMLAETATVNCDLVESKLILTADVLLTSNKSKS